jgi:hypothetical protein
MRPSQLHALRKPLGIAPKSPAIDFIAPRGRERLVARAA